MTTHRLAGLAFFLLGIIGVAGPIHADTAAHTKAVIQAEYNSQNAAFAHRDGVGTLAYVAPDFCGISLQGQQIGRAERQAGMPQMFALMKSGTMTTQIQQFALQGRVSTVQAILYTNLTVQDPRTGKITSGVIENVVRDVWAYNGRAWLLERSQQLSVKRLR